MEFSELKQADRRLVILMVLMQSDHYSANEHLVRSMMDVMGHNVGRDLLRGEFDWLTEQRLIDLTTFGDIKIAQLTPRGKDVAEGRTVVTGVKRPEPG